MTPSRTIGNDIMRTSFLTATGVLAISLMAGCTVKDVEPPSLAGPSTLVKAITMSANKDTLFQNGVDFVDILLTSTSPTGQAQSIPLRAEIFVGGVAQDYGTLSTKNPITPSTITSRARRGLTGAMLILPAYGRLAARRRSPTKRRRGSLLPWTPSRIRV